MRTSDVWNKPTLMKCTLVAIIMAMLVCASTIAIAAPSTMPTAQSSTDLHLIFPVRLPAQLNQGYHDHWSLDFSRPGLVKDREDVIAAHDGILTQQVLKDGAWCAFVRIGDYQTAYCHLTKNSIPKSKLNKQVKQGEVIGKVGQTGKASGPHVHFDLFNVRTKQYEQPVPMCGVTSFPTGSVNPYVQYTQCNNNAPSPPPTDSPYDNQPPGPSGCWTNTTQTPKQAIIRDPHGNQLGIVELKWSPKCQTNWASITSSIGKLTIRETVESRTGKIYSDSDNDTTYGYSPMVYAPNIQARGCGYLLKGNTILGSACTDWY